MNFKCIKLQYVCSHDEAMVCCTKVVSLCMIQLWCAVPRQCHWARYSYGVLYQGSVTARYSYGVLYQGSVTVHDTAMVCCTKVVSLCMIQLLCAVPRQCHWARFFTFCFIMEFACRLMEKADIYSKLLILIKKTQFCQLKY